MTSAKYELTFRGAATVRGYSIPAYQRYHDTMESARKEEARVYAAMEAAGINAAAHDGMIYQLPETLS